MMPTERKEKKNKADKKNGYDFHPCCWPTPSFRAAFLVLKLVVDK